MMPSKAKELVIQLEEERRKKTEDGNPSVSGSDTRLKKNPLGEILRENLPWILANDRFTKEQKKAAGMIAVCKTEALGGYLEYCTDCDRAVDFHYCSCNNRNCPYCQYPMQERWNQLRMNEVIPGIPYYHIILTCPHELNPLFQSNSKALLGLLMRSSAQAVVKMCRNPKILGAVPSILSVLHTWSSDLLPHFHSHMLVSGGGLNPDGEFVSLTELRKAQKRSRKKARRNKGNDYFMPLPALKAVFRGMFMSGLRRLYDEHQLNIPASLDELNDPFMWSRFCHDLEQKVWVGDIEKAAAKGENVIGYFARYAYRTAISNSRILSYDGDTVRFTSRDKNVPGGKKVISLDVHSFICRFLSHILPKGFTRVRTFGLLSNSTKNKNLKSIHEQLHLNPYAPSPYQDLKGVELMMALFPDKSWSVCPNCQGVLVSIPFGNVPARGTKRKRQKKRTA